MVKLYNPPTVPSPAAFYSHVAEVGANARWIHISGQVGTNPDGTMAEGFEAQAHRVWQNTIAILEAAGMGMENLVKYTTLLVNHDDVAAMRDIRDHYLGGHAAASTLFVVSGLASPAWLIEMESIAAKEG